MNGDNHGDALQEIVIRCFKRDGKGYTATITVLHQMLVSAMTCNRPRIFPT